MCRGERERREGQPQNLLSEKTAPKLTSQSSDDGLGEVDLVVGERLGKEVEVVAQGGTGAGIAYASSPLTKPDGGVRSENACLEEVHRVPNGHRNRDHDEKRLPVVASQRKAHDEPRTGHSQWLPEGRTAR